MMKDKIIIIGGGLAGSEAAYQIAKRKINVDLYEMKPTKFSPAHQDKNLAEIVCSNSFKSNLLTNACGLLKEELRRLDSLLIKVADQTRVPAGQALAVDREKFAKKVTEELRKNPYINIINKEVVSRFDKKLSTISAQNVYFEDLIKSNIVIIATGPLTSESLYEGIKHLIGEESLHFYDAEAPIIEKNSINFNVAFYGNRYDEEKKKDESPDDWKQRIKSEEASYINLPMNKEEYEAFCNELLKAEVVTLKEFEKSEIFEGCMPIEIMCKRGIDTLRFGPLKPVGFDDPRTGKRPYAVVQLRQDNKEGTLYNIVGFQTNLKYGEQKRIFSIIPGLENVEFAKYGVMHRNTFINSPELLDNTYNLKKNRNIYFAGQITGVEGYVESISSGMKASINATQKLLEESQNAEQNINKEKILESQETTKKKINSANKKIINESDNHINQNDKVKIEIMNNEDTMIGALSKYISETHKDFQPMNANYGILRDLDEKIKDKKVKYQKMSDRSLTLFQF